MTKRDCWPLTEYSRGERFSELTSELEQDLIRLVNGGSVVTSLCFAQSRHDSAIDLSRKCPLDGSELLKLFEVQQAVANAGDWIVQALHNSRHHSDLRRLNSIFNWQRRVRKCVSGFFTRDFERFYGWIKRSSRRICDGFKASMNAIALLIWEPRRQSLDNAVPEDKIALSVDFGAFSFESSCQRALNNLFIPSCK